jgi:hypothetical protein
LALLAHGRSRGGLQLRVALSAEAAAEGSDARESAADLLRRKASKGLTRYRGDGFDLDLGYVGERVVVVAAAADLREVARFLERRHPQSYKTVFLGAAPADASRLRGAVSEYALDPSTPPPLLLLPEFCYSVHAWLRAHPQNVMVVCDAAPGADLSGVLVSSFLLFSRAPAAADAAAAIAAFRAQRTLDGAALQLPSQRRYVEYAEQYLARERAFKAAAALSEHDMASPALFLPQRLVFIRSLSLRPLPRAVRPSAKEVWLEIRDPLSSTSTRGRVQPRRSKERGVLDFALAQLAPVTEDVLVEVFYATLFGRERLAALCFNTRLLERASLTLPKAELDGPHLDTQHRRFARDFAIELQFEFVDISLPALLAAPSAPPNPQQQPPQPPQQPQSPLSAFSDPPGSPASRDAVPRVLAFRRARLLRGADDTQALRALVAASNAAAAAATGSPSSPRAAPEDTPASPSTPTRLSLGGEAAASASGSDRIKPPPPPGPRPHVRALGPSPSSSSESLPQQGGEPGAPDERARAASVAARDALRVIAGGALPPEGEPAPAALSPRNRSVSAAAMAAAEIIGGGAPLHHPTRRRPSAPKSQLAVHLRAFRASEPAEPLAPAPVAATSQPRRIQPPPPPRPPPQRESEGEGEGEGEGEP